MNDEAVSDVIGSTLMVGITVGLMAGLSLAVLSIDGPDDDIHADLSVDTLRGGGAWGEGDEQVRIRHLGGEAIPDHVEVLVTVDGIPTTYTPNDQGFSDGRMTIGEQWTLTRTLNANATISVAVVDPLAEALVVLAADVGVGQQNTVPPVANATYVATATTTTGTLDAFASAQSDTDGGAPATLTEASLGGTPSTVRLSPATLAASSGTSKPDNVLVSDNKDAKFTGPGDSVLVEDFTLSGGATISSVVIGFEGSRGKGGSTDSTLTLSYLVAGSPGTLLQSFVVSGNGDSDRTLDVTADRAWTEADVQNLQILLTRDSLDPGFRDPVIDHMFVDVTTVTGQLSDLDVDFHFTGVPVALTQELQIRYRTTGDTFALQVWDGTQWNQRAVLASSTFTTATYALTAAEYDLGAPDVRFVDLDSDTGQGVLEIDYARVVGS